MRDTLTYRLLPPRPSDDAPDRVDWRDIVLGVGLWAILVALSCMAAAAV